MCTLQDEKSKEQSTVSTIPPKMYKTISSTFIYQIEVKKDKQHQEQEQEQERQPQQQQQQQEQGQEQ